MRPEALVAGTGTEIPAKEIEELTSGLSGSALGSEDTGYDEARRLWNGMIDRRPGLSSDAPVRKTWPAVSTSPETTTCSWPCAAAAIPSRASPCATGDS